MSKSLGNVIDPLDIIHGIKLEDLHKSLLTGNLDNTEVERAKAYQKSAFPEGIEECGADALRFTIVNYTTGGSDIAFDIKEIEAKRRFCNKIYQATKFALNRIGEGFQPDVHSTDNDPQSLAEKWILHRLNLAAKEVDNAIESGEFSVATGILYQYWFKSMCDTFIENSKYLLMAEAAEQDRKSAQQTLYTALEGGLLLMHPVMPYLTESLWQKLPRRQGDRTECIMIAKFPEFQSNFDRSLEAEQYEFVMDIASGIRHLLSRYRFKEPGDLIVQTYSESAFKTALEQKMSIKYLSGKTCGELEIVAPTDGNQPPAGCVLQSINANAVVYLKIVGRIDISEEIRKYKEILTNASVKVKKYERIMHAKGWEKATKETKQKEQENFADANKEVEHVERALQELERFKLEDYSDTIMR